MSDGFKARYNEETGTWEEYKEPYATINFPTKKDFKMFEKMLELYMRMHWHPADEPPEIDESHESAFVLLNISNFYVPVVGFYAEYEEDGGAYYSYDSDEPLVKDDLYVTAWMSLPERYKEYE